MIIYKATNLINGKIYIGQTVNTLKYRKYQHIRDSKRLYHNNDHFHNAIAKYGEESFKFEVIDTALSQEELDEKERYWISFYESNNRDLGYNEDEGGKSGGRKSQQTKDKIGLTTKQRWQDEDTAKKMMDGLRKGTEVWKEQCRNNRVLFVCPYCGKKMKLAPWEAKNKTACSQKCKAEHGGFTERWNKAVKASAEASKKRNNELKAIIAEDILNWSNSNSALILNCPYNKITATLAPLLSLIKSKYNISDIRSLFKCFNVTSKKEFLNYLKEYLKDSE